MDEDLKNMSDLYFEVFGVEPVITGINYGDSDSLTDRLFEAIMTEVPYVEQELPEGIDS